MEKKKSIKFYLKSNGKNSSNFTTSPMSPAAKLIFKPKESKKKKNKRISNKLNFIKKINKKKNKELISLKIPTKIKQMLDRGRKDLTLLSLWRELQQTHIELTL